MELQHMITAMKEVNLCSYFLLPLLGLSKLSFGENNFVNSYLSEDGSQIYVRVYRVADVPGGVRLGVTKVVTADKQEYLLFNFPDMWKEDIETFMEGKYSLLSDSAKQIIRTTSGLDYKGLGEDGKYYTDFRIIALTRNPDLVAEWKSHLYDPNDRGLCILDTDPTIELLEAPGDYMFFRGQIEYTETL